MNANLLIKKNLTNFALLPSRIYWSHLQTYFSVLLETSEQHIAFDQQLTIKLRTKVHSFLNNDGLALCSWPYSHNVPASAILYPTL